MRLWTVLLLRYTMHQLQPRHGKRKIPDRLFFLFSQKNNIFLGTHFLCIGRFRRLRWLDFQLFFRKIFFLLAKIYKKRENIFGVERNFSRCRAICESCGFAEKYFFVAKIKKTIILQWWPLGKCKTQTVSHRCPALAHGYRKNVLSATRLDVWLTLLAYQTIEPL